MTTMLDSETTTVGYMVFANATRLLKHREQNKIADKHLPKILRVLKKQRRLFMDKYRKTKSLFPSKKDDAWVHGPKNLDLELPWTYGPLPPWEYQSALSNVWDLVAQQTESELQDAVIDIEIDAMVAGVDHLSMALDVGTSLNLDNPRAVKWFEEYGGSTRYIKDINETTGNKIATQISNGLDLGKSYTQIGKEIQQLGAFSNHRARLIAVTESARAYESGNHILGQELQSRGLIIEHHWNDSGDDRVTPECMANSAVGWIPLNEPFPSGDLHPPRFPGCRCYTTTRRAEDQPDLGVPDDIEEVKFYSTAEVPEEYSIQHGNREF